jgi:hypothetical protein
MKIYNQQGQEIYDIAVDDSSVRYRSIMSDDSLTLNFSLTESVEIPRYAYVDFEGSRYTLWRPEEFKKNGTRNNEYTLTLHGYREFLKFVKFKDTSAKPYRLKFFLTGKPVDFMNMLVDSLNDKDAGWSVGDCIDAAEKTLSFNHEYCLDVLARIALEFNTEYEFEGKKIHLRKVEKFKDDPLPLSYGKGNGFLPGVGRYNDGDKQPIGRLYVQGGERNIDFSSYGSKTLLLPKSAMLEYGGKTYRTDADGMYITRDGNNNAAEDSYDASEIYPSRVGTVTAVEVIDAEKNFYDIIDTTIPETLDYGNFRIAGEKATIVFQTGALAGREFDIEQTDNALTGYIHAERRFKIVPAELDGIAMPGGVFVPAVGDKYAIFNISLPQAYIQNNSDKSGASWDMMREAVKYFAENEEEKFRFTGELDGIWSKSRWLEIGGKIVPGGYVLFSDTQFQPQGVLIRITAIKDYVNKPHKPEITLSNASPSGSFSAELGNLNADEVVIEESKKEAIRYSKRQWRDARETMQMLEQLLLNFSGSINPITVQTMQLLVGDESLQFRFVNSKTNPTSVNHVVNFNTSNKTLTSEAGIIQHMTLGVDTITNSHPASDYLFWDVELYTSPALTDTQKSYYLYARCSKNDQNGIFLLSEVPIGIEENSDYYHFLLGILNCEKDGDRSLALLYGFSEVLPGRITAQKIISADGSTFFDLDAGVISGKITFQSGSQGYNNLADAPDLSVYSLQADVNALVSNLQAQIDGQIMTWFDTYVPALSNAPATSWTTDTDKDKHLGDLFYNKTTGLGYRFSKTGTVYSWELLKDTDVAVALANAAAAQDTADGKRRVFVAQPTTADAYDVGDLWANATYSPTYSNDLLKCKTAKASGVAFNIAHWEKASKYTDDAAANAAAAAAANAQTAANTANSLLADIASDGKLTPSEKQAVKKEWDVIPTEMGTIMNQADNYGITYYDLEDRFYELADYINPLLANLTVTSDIDGATFRQKFKNYYDQKNSVLSAISIRAKELADLAQQTADSIAIGGSNLLPNSESPTGFIAYQGSSLTVTNNYSIPEFGTTNAVRLQTSGGTHVLKTYRYIVNAMENGRVVSLSFYVKNLGTADLVLFSNIQKTTTVGAGVALRVKWEGLVGNGVSNLQIQLRAPTTGQNVDAAIWRIKFENGNRCTDWSPAPEEIDAQLVVLNAKTAGRTVIEGGVVESELIMLGNGGISGMSGIPVDTNNNPLPSRWAGGTYQEAIDKIANIVEWFNGDAKFGDLWIDAAGSIAIKDTNGVLKVLLTKNDITTLAAIAGSTQNSTINNATNDNIIEGTTTVLLANSIVVNNNNSTVTVSCVISSNIIRDDKLMMCNGIADVSIYLYNTTTGNNVYIAKLHVVAADAYSASDSLNVGVAVAMPAGTYKLKIIYSHDNYSNCIFNSSISASTTTVVFNGAKQRLEIGKNGIGIIGNSNNYSWMGLDGGVYKSVEKVTSGGVYDKPGVLASGSISSVGGTVISWGAKASNSSKPSTGTYTINHTVGHTNYMVLITPQTASRVGYVYAKNTTSVTIKMTNMSGTATDAAFDYCIIGNN